MDAGTIVHSYSSDDRLPPAEIETNTIGTYTDTFHSSEARAKKVAAYAKEIVALCPKLEVFNAWATHTDHAVKDSFTSELEEAVDDLVNSVNRGVP